MSAEAPTLEALQAPDVIIEPCEFWFLWTKHGHMPRVVHAREEDARAEAHRLAQKHPGRKFILLRACEKFHVAAPVATEDKP